MLRANDYGGNLLDSFMVYSTKNILNAMRYVLVLETLFYFY